MEFFNDALDLPFLNRFHPAISVKIGESIAGGINIHGQLVPAIRLLTGSGDDALDCLLALTGKTYTRIVTACPEAERHFSWGR